jgi:hypothetical protein
MGRMLILYLCGIVRMVRLTDEAINLWPSSLEPTPSAVAQHKVTRQASALALQWKQLSDTRSELIPNLALTKHS